MISGKKKKKSCFVLFSIASQFWDHVAKQDHLLCGRSKFLKENGEIRICSMLNKKATSLPVTACT